MSYAQNPRLAGLGVYQMAQATVGWTGGEMDDEIRRFGNEVTATNGDINSNRNALISAGAEGTRFWNEWQIFMRDWGAYQTYRARTGPSWFQTHSSSALVTLRTLVDRYNTLEGRFRSLTGVSSTPRSGDTRPPSFWTSATNAATGVPGLLAAGGLAVVALIAVAVIATQARAFAQPALSAMRRNMLTKSELDALLREASRRGPSRKKRRASETLGHALEGRDPKRRIPVSGAISGKDTPKRKNR